MRFKRAFNWRPASLSSDVVNASATSDLTGDSAEPSSSGPDLEERLLLLRESYSEVLDATKHQDDKVGRLLTASAFWTAGSLTLLGLSSGEIARCYWEFHRDPMSPIVIGPIVMWLGIIYIGLMCAASALLIASIMTPLRIPKMGTLQGANRAPGSHPRSQLYFMDIAGLSIDGWGCQWQQSVNDLKKVRIDNYKIEVHNLAVRTAHKYARTNEAVALLQLMLLTLSLLGAAALWGMDGENRTPNGAVVLTGPIFWIFVSFVSLWIFMTVAVRAVSSIVTGRMAGTGVKMTAGILLSFHIVMIGWALDQSVSSTNSPWPVRVGVLLGWLGVYLLAFGGNPPRWPQLTSIVRRVRFFTTFSIFICVSLPPLLFLLFDQHPVVLLSFFGVPLPLTLDALVTPLALQWDRQRASAQETLSAGDESRAGHS